MPSEFGCSTNRRRFLQYLASSPLFAAGGFASYAAEELPIRPKLPDPVIWAPASMQDLITSPKEAINVFDFEPVARKNVPPAHSATWRRASTMKSPCARTARAS